MHSRHWLTPLMTVLLMAAAAPLMAGDSPAAAAITWKRWVLSMIRVPGYHAP